ncbi:MAG TPA: Flp family type IVb pilin [Xanthobacteraceae bacterium]|jgi:pilus assembly protein Flp/PilA|nr:Flp family type IVb pilin [Xanthobacteraceae bacterium]
MGQLVRRFAENESAATAVEYGLIAAGISVAIISVINSLGASLRTTFLSVDREIAAK